MSQQPSRFLVYQRNSDPIDFEPSEKFTETEDQEYKVGIVTSKALRRYKDSILLRSKVSRIINKKR